MNIDQLGTSPWNKHRDTAKLLQGNTKGPDSPISRCDSRSMFPAYASNGNITKFEEPLNISDERANAELNGLNSDIRNSDWQVNTPVIKPGTKSTNLDVCGVTLKPIDKEIRCKIGVPTKSSGLKTVSNFIKLVRSVHQKRHGTVIRESNKEELTKVKDTPCNLVFSDVTFCRKG